MSLFDSSFQTTDSYSEIEVLKKQYPKYHHGYIFIGADLSSIDIKRWLETLWQQYEPYADAWFLDEFKKQLFQRLWELYLAATFINRGYKLGKHRDAGADIEVIRDDGSSVWIEAIAVNKGEGNDQVPDTPIGHWVDIPTDQILLRLASGLKAKHDKYLIDLASNRIKESEPYVIAIDRSSIGHHVDSFMPNVLKVLFGIGAPAVDRAVSGNSERVPNITWTGKFEIEKRNGKSVSSLFFEDPAHEGISAVIYSKDQVIDSPRLVNEMGENLVIVHNPYAKNPLSDAFFVFGTHYRATESRIEVVKQAKPFLKPQLGVLLS